MKSFSVFLLLSSNIFLSCFGYGDSDSDRITEKYIVLWIDWVETRSINEEIEKYSSSSTQIVPQYVFAVGHNDHFIIAKQHPTSDLNDKFEYEIDTTITNYFIIDILKKETPNESKLIGPLTQTKFDSLRKILKIEHIKFDQNYPEKP